MNFCQTIPQNASSFTTYYLAIGNERLFSINSWLAVNVLMLRIATKRPLCINIQDKH